MSCGNVDSVVNLFASDFHRQDHPLCSAIRKSLREDVEPMITYAIKPNRSVIETVPTHESLSPEIMRL